MSKTIFDVSVLDLLPDNLKNDPDMIAASKAVDASTSDLANSIDLLLLLYNIDQQSDAVLEHLLYQFHITDDQGAGLAETREEKINLILNFFEIHRLKGTKAALERVLELLNMRGEIKEWFEYGGEPHHFKIEILETISNKDGDFFCLL